MGRVMFPISRRGLPINPKVNLLEYKYKRKGEENGQQAKAIGVCLEPEAAEKHDSTGRGLLSAVKAYTVDPRISYPL